MKLTTLPFKTGAAVGLMMWATFSQAGIYADGLFSVSRALNKGSSVKTLKSHNNHFCVLVKVEMSEIDGGKEFATCEIKRGETKWKLEARLQNNSDAAVSCKAQCYSHGAVRPVQPDGRDMRVGEFDSNNSRPSSDNQRDIRRDEFSGDTVRSSNDEVRVIRADEFDSNNNRSSGDNQRDIRGNEFSGGTVRSSNDLVRVIR
ncbi:MAG: hypothetical protein COA99_16210 [Moraxellaceae bacterium]|nr:MAG: hypothetical protein COA99_16210 [Moraxellaceae bacterium]